MPRTWFVAFVTMQTVAIAVACAEPASTPNQVISHIPRRLVHSRAIAKIGYSKRRHILEIEFVNGAIYRYFDVPPAVYRELMSSESKARFYDSNIRRRYRSIPIRSRQKEQAPMKSPASAQDRDVSGPRIEAKFSAHSWSKRTGVSSSLK